MNQERWQKFSLNDHIRHIGAEFERARVSEESGNVDSRRAALERALELIDASLTDPRWRSDSLKLLTIRAEAAKAYAGEPGAEIRALCRAL